MPRRPLNGEPMQKRLSISLLPGQDRKLKAFAKRCSMSAATIGRMGIEFMMELAESRAVPEGYQGTVMYTLQEKLKPSPRKRVSRRGSKP